MMLPYFLRVVRKVREAGKHLTAQYWCILTLILTFSMITLVTHFILSLFFYSGLRSGHYIGKIPHWAAPICESAERCRFMIVADLDEKSIISTSKGKTFRSYARVGYLEHVNSKYSVSWEPETEITSSYNYEGRGMELSELISFNGELLSFDDRTGIIYKHFPNGSISPEYILAEGDGTYLKGMKVEWATRKNGQLWIGSFGKEFVDAYGNILHEHPMWITVINRNGEIRRYNWKIQYNRIRNALSAPHPGYCIHEAINWSDVHQRWYILPRRLSIHPYNEKLDEKQGTNVLAIANEDFSDITVLTIGERIEKRGFSSFKFVPGTKDTLVLALKTEEDSATNTQKSFITLFSINGTILLPDVEISGNFKYEGVEFI